MNGGGKRNVWAIQINGILNVNELHFRFVQVECQATIRMESRTMFLMWEFWDFRLQNSSNARNNIVKLVMRPPCS